jgi:hypothetical protein
MPPSGFNKRAINALLVFIEECYKDLLKKIEKNPTIDVKEAIQEELSEIRNALESFNIKK